MRACTADPNMRVRFCVRSVYNCTRMQARSSGAAFITAKTLAKFNQPIGATQKMVQSSPCPRPGTGQGSSRPPVHGRQADLVQAAMFKSPHALIDIGINLCDKGFEKDRLDVIARADSVHVKAMVVTGKGPRK